MLPMAAPVPRRMAQARHADSWYEASVRRPASEPILQGSVGADVLVVGAGFAGLSAAIELAQRGYSVVVLEAEQVCAAASGRNGGQAIVGFASGQGVMEAQLGKADARRAWNMALEGVQLIDERIARFHIDCDRVHGYLYVAETARKARALREELALLRTDYGLDCDLVEGAAVQAYIQSPRYCAAGFETVSGHLHPLKYGLGLAAAARAAGVQIFEHSPVRALQQGDQVVATAGEGRVQARFAVLAGNCGLDDYGLRTLPQVTARRMPVGTYIAATAPLDPALRRRLIPSDAAVCDNNFLLDYYRFSADNRLLFGGLASYSMLTPANLRGRMQARIAQVFPALAGASVEHVWGGLVDISMNRAPDFGRIGPNIYYLQGFSGHGVALTGLAGRLVAEAVAGHAERFDIFARIRHRSFPGGPAMRMPTLVVGMWYERLRDAL
jgi:gamma-glutamylputrescine oxidase